jgi:hypothetical protein
MKKLLLFCLLFISCQEQRSNYDYFSTIDTLDYLTPEDTMIIHKIDNAETIEDIFPYCDGSLN